MHILLSHYEIIDLIWSGSGYRPNCCVTSQQKNFIFVLTQSPAFVIGAKQGNNPLKVNHLSWMRFEFSFKVYLMIHQVQRFFTLCFSSHDHMTSSLYLKSGHFRNITYHMTDWSHDSQSLLIEICFSRSCILWLALSYNRDSSILSDWTATLQ